MRKTLALLLAFLMLVAVCAGCGGKKDPDSSVPDIPDNSIPLPDSSDVSEPEPDSSTEEPSSSSSTPGQGSGNHGQKPNTPTTTTTRNKNSNTGRTIPVTNLTWDVMRGKGGAEAQAVSMRQAVVNSKDSLKISGTKYYFSESGSDTNDGKSPNTPLKSLRRLSRLTLKAGDAVLLERNSVFRIDRQIDLVSGVSYGAYGSGNKPEIWCSAMNYSEGNPWTKHEGNIWKVSYNYTNAGQLVADDGKLVGNKVFSLKSVKKQGDFYCDDQGTLYLYCSKDPNTYSDIEIACNTSIMGGDSLQNITIENLTLKYAGCHGVGISNGRGITVRNCVFGWIGGMVQRPGSGDNTRLGNAIEFFNNGNDLTIQNNWIYEAYDTGFTFQGTKGPFTNIRVSNNLIEYCVMSIEMWSGDHGTPIDAVIENNVLRFANYGWGTMPDRIVRGGHIWMTWRLGEPYTNLKIAMNNNVFDCTYSYIFSYPWSTPTTGSMQFTYSGNAYYQRNHVGGADKVMFGSKNNYAFYWGENATPNYANNQAELEAAVRAVDPQAKTIQWLG